MRPSYSSYRSTQPVYTGFPRELPVQPAYTRQSGPLPVDIGLSEPIVTRTGETFKMLLGMEYVLYVKTQAFHWNVTGMNFYSLHNLFQKQYEQLAEFIDLIAEQVRQYGMKAPKNMRDFITLNGLGGGMVESEDDNLDRVGMINQLLDSHQTIAQVINSTDKIDYTGFDLGAQDLIGTLVSFHQKTAWMLRALLE